MSDITNKVTSVSIDRATLVNLMNHLANRELDKDSTPFDIGYEKAKRETRAKLAKVLMLDPVDSAFERFRRSVSSNVR